MKLFTKIAILGLVAALTCSFAAEEVVGKYGAITIKKYTANFQGSEREELVAVIDDKSDETPVISEDIAVDSVYYSRIFKAGVTSTLMLPFEVDTWRLGVSAFEYVEVKKDCVPQCSYRVNVRTIYPQKIKANTPYIVISEGADRNISFHMRHGNPDKVTLNTTTNDKSVPYTIDDINWTFRGTYDYIKFTDPRGTYGFAAKDKNDVKMGDFKKAACNDTSCAYIRPFRAYLKCSMVEETSPKEASGAALFKAAPASDSDVIANLPESIEVRIIDDNGGSTHLGYIDTRTGEITQEDRWFDMKGRRLLHKPVVKGVYYKNGNKVILK